MSSSVEGRDPFTTTDPERERAERVYGSLTRLAERHAASPAARGRAAHPTLLSAHEAVRLVGLLAGGVVDGEEGEPEVDDVDLLAALTLLPLLRGEVDELEAGLLASARGRGMTWSQIAFGLGLRSAQAAQQRAERLASRGEAAPEAAVDSAGLHAQVDGRGR